MLRELMKFLQEKELFERYLNYCQEPGYGGLTPPNQKVSEYLKERATPQMYIWYPFTWAKTPEGVDFWRNINKEWSKKLKQHELTTNQPGA